MKKNALFMSVLSLLLCVAMLVGTTFAWFTDEVVSGNNVIAAGNLDIELEYYKDSKWNTVKDATDLFSTELWEPGHTQVVYLRLSNLGSLALKYQLGIHVASETPGVNVDGDSFNLSDHIEYGVVENINGETGAFADRAAARSAVTQGTKLSAGYTAKGNMLANAAPLYMALVVYMPESVDNVANYRGDAVPTINLGVNLQAIQLTHENDSYGNDYDATAGGTYSVLYTFDDAADLLNFAPKADDVASSGLSLNGNGQAQIDKKGAWYTVDADFTANEYTVEYDIDITALAEGENVTVDTGESTNWGSTPIVLERGSTKVYYGTWKNEYLGELEGTSVHVTHSYTMSSEGSLVITTTVSDGKDTVTYSKTVTSAAQTGLHWDIYTVTESGKATLDNFCVSAEKRGTDLLPTGVEEVAEGLYKVDGAYYVTSAEGLATLNGMMIDGSAGKDVVVNLADDIDFAGKTWTPVDGHYEFKFSLKELNGNGHTISNLTVNGQAMFSRFVSTGDVVVKDLTFDKAQVNSNGNINTAILVAHTYANLLLDNVDVKNSAVTGGYKVATLVGTVYDEDLGSAKTLTVKNCDVENCTVTTTVYDFMTCGMVAFVYVGDGEKIVFENSTISDTNLVNTKSGGYDYHAFVYYNDQDTDDCFNEAEGVTVTNCTVIKN